MRSWPYAIANRGSPPDYYRLTPLGFRLLHGEHALPPSKRHFSEVSIAHHHHTHCLADFVVHTLVAAHRRTIRVAHFYRENSLRLHVGADVFLCPDCAFELHTPGGQQFNFLVELDGGTERVRSQKDADSWQQKIRLYNLLQDRNYPDRFRVLIVTTRCSDRLQSILTLAAQNASNPQRSLFYAVALPDYLAQPDALCRPCFRDHRGNSVRSCPTCHRPPLPFPRPFAGDLLRHAAMLVSFAPCRVASSRPRGSPPRILPSPSS